MRRSIPQQPSRISAAAASPYRLARHDTKETLPFYKTPEWRQLIAAVIDERGRRCESCGVIPSRIYGDHIIEIEDGGAPLDRSNIKLLCATCHGIKTAKSRASRRAGSR